MIPVCMKFYKGLISCLFIFDSWPQLKMNLKKILKLFRNLILLVILLFIGFYFYIKNYWKNFANETEINNLITNIKSADKLPEKFYTLYNIEKTKSLNTSYNEQGLRTIFGSKFISLPSSQASIIGINLFFRNKIKDYRRFKIAQISITWLIESRVSQSECLNWVTQNYDFLNNANGIKQASNLYFKKNIEHLNDYELASLIIMLDNSSYYNPFRRKHKIEERVDKLLRKAKVANKD